MNYIKYDASTVDVMKKAFEENNNNIAYSLSKIDEELSNMTVVLNTPKSNKGMGKIIEIMKENSELVSNEGDKMINRFNKIKESYEKYINETKGQVEGDYE